MSKKMFQRQCDLLTARAMSRLLIIAAAVITLAACNGGSDRAARPAFAPIHSNAATSILTPAAHDKCNVSNLISCALNTMLAAGLQIAMSLPVDFIDLTADSGAKTSVVPATTEKTTALRPVTLTILHIEDNPADLRLMRQMFVSLHNLTLRDVRTGEFGITLATANPPALILLDIGLPGINGAEVLRRLRSHPATRDIPVVAITSYSRALGIELGLSDFDDYLAKPISAARLQTILNRRLGEINKEPSDPATLVQQ